MNLSRHNRTLAGLLALTALVVACDSSPTEPTSALQQTARIANTTETIIPGSIGDLTTSTPEGGLVKVCKLGNASGTFAVTTSPINGGATSAPNTPTVAPNSCVIVAISQDYGPLGQWVTVSETSAGLQGITAATVNSSTGVYSTLTFANGDSVPSNRYHGATITFTNYIAPPPAVCAGLTPGYWKNWRNHYTAAQFASLLPGTIASSIAQADAIFAAKGSNSIAKLKWFVLANQLTLNLTAASSLPNPSSGSLSGSCVAVAGGPELGGTLSTALNILNGVGGPYTDAYILGIKDILDAIANLLGG